MIAEGVAGGGGSDVMLMIFQFNYGQTGGRYLYMFFATLKLIETHKTYQFFFNKIRRA